MKEIFRNNKSVTVQKVIISCLCLYVFFDSIGVLIDYYNNRVNYRTFDGWGDGIKSMFFAFIVGVTMLFINRKDSKRDFFVTLILFVSFLFAISSFGIGVFWSRTLFTGLFILYAFFDILFNNLRSEESK